jgi:uracil-DNA glycosylase family 4
MCTEAAQPNPDGERVGKSIRKGDGKMIEFTDCSSCTECDLYERCKNPGIPTRVFSHDGRDKALLVVGQNPGYNEDQKGVSWIGWAGELLSRFLMASEMSKYCDIYLSNACRCFTPAKVTPTSGQVGKCRRHLDADIHRLAAEYDEVVVLACGASAARAVSGIKSLSAAFKKQGMLGVPVKTEEGSTSPVLFFTYHPAILHTGRKPALIHAVEAHFTMLGRYLEGLFIPNKLAVAPATGQPPPAIIPPFVCLDIETYGMLKGYEQTVFHPVKSKTIDGVDYKDQVVSVCIGYKKNGETHLYYYNYQNPTHRRIVELWFQRIVESNITLLGQNIKFDLLYLSSCNKVINYYVDPRKLMLDDTLLWGFLYFEQAPEKGLKELAALFGITNYDGLNTASAGGTAVSGNDPNLRMYNATDVAATIALQEELEERIIRRYGAQSTKLGQACADMRNRAVWDTMELERSGCCFDMDRLSSLHALKKRLVSEAEEKLRGAGITPSGKGSDSSLRSFITECIEECALDGDSRLVVTKKRKEVSIVKENVELILGFLEPGKLRDNLLILKDLRKQAKVISTYTRPLLTDKRKGIVSVSNDAAIGIAYPTWYPAPGYHSRGGSDDEKQGGTIQGRFACSKPPAQTFTTEIEKCLTCIHRPGKLVGYDLGQIELRMAALLSGDQLMMDAFLNNVDLHTQTTVQVLYPDAVPDGSEGWILKRQLGKKLNFLVLFKGGAKAFQDTARRELGLFLSIELCEQYVEEWYYKHIIFKQWQDELLDTAFRTGYIELPTGWSRMFGKGSASLSYIAEICNFPIQTLSAQLLQSAQFVILQRFRAEGISSRIMLQVHDSLVISVCRYEEREVDLIVHEALINPPLMRILEDFTGRTIGLVYERKELDIRGRR